MDFSGRHILITGGSSGTGAHMATAFAEAGGHVTITGRRLDALERVAATAPNITWLQADVSSEDAVKSMFDNRDVPFDTVIANAGIAESAPLSKLTLESWENIIRINATGVFLTVREGLKQMNSFGRLIIVSSILGSQGAPYASAYAASKHATLGLMKSVALEIAKTDITINAICPGYIDTEMTDRTIENIMTKTGQSREQAISALTQYNPQGKLITCEEVTHTAFHLASRGASTINGQAMMLCGGGF